MPLVRGIPDAFPHPRAETGAPRAGVAHRRPAPGGYCREGSAGVHLAVLRQRRPRGPGRSRAGGPLRRGHGAPFVRARVRDRPAEAARLQPAPRGTRLVEPAYRHRDRQRRHAVPGRLGDDGGEPPGLHAAPFQPSDLRHEARPGRPPRILRPARQGWPARVAHPCRGGPRDRRGTPEGSGQRHPRCPRRREGRRPGLAGDERAHARGREGNRDAAGVPPGRGNRRDSRFPRMGGRRPLHVPGLPRVRARNGGRRRPAAHRRALRPGRAARAAAGRGVAQLHGAAGTAARARASPGSSCSPRRMPAPPCTGPGISTTSA